MTTNWDAPTCETCRGKGRILLSGKNAASWIEVNCRTCHSTGRQGPPPVPREPDPDHRPPVAEHPAVRELEVCGQCLGAGEVVSLGSDISIQSANTLLKSPCPACSTVLNAVQSRATATARTPEIGVRAVCLALLGPGPCGRSCCR